MPTFGFNGRMEGSNLRQSARASTSFLLSTVSLDWDRAIPGMLWSVREVVAHISEVLLWNAGNLSGGTKELTTLELKVLRSSEPVQLIETLTVSSALLGYVVDGVPPGQRGWHPEGIADATGFSAMGCDELLVHTSDAARGLGLEFEPPEVLSQMVLRGCSPGRRGTPTPGRRCSGRPAGPSSPAWTGRRTGIRTPLRCPSGTASSTDRPALTGPP